VFVSGAEAAILHADLDAFYASVEQRDDPRLRGRPVIVGGGVVLAASYEAKAFGVQTAMGGRQARSLCPNAIVVPPRMDAYTEASRAVFEIFGDTTPLVEGISIDEAFLDVGGLRRVSGAPEEIAKTLRREVFARVGLRITVGVARTKFLAKVASRVGKPDGLLVVPPDEELAFLHPLPVDRLWGVGAVTAAKLHEHGMTTVHDVALVGESTVVAPVGTCTRSRTTTIRVRCRSAGGADRSAPNVPSASGAIPRPRSMPRWSPSSTASPGGCAQPLGSVARWCCGCVSTTSGGPRARTHSRARPRIPRRSSPPRAHCSRPPGR
jgi:hypothetical protein